MGGRGASGTTSSIGSGGKGNGKYTIPKFTTASLDKMSRAELSKLYNMVAVNHAIDQSSQWSKVTIDRTEAQKRVSALKGATSTSGMKRFIKKHGK